MASQAEKRRDIVIIGGGIIGCTSAYFLSRHPSYDSQKHSITLLEASEIAGGASGKAGGLLALWAYPSCIVPLSYKLHKELAVEHDGVKRWGYRAVHCGQVECIGQDFSSRKSRTSEEKEKERVSLKKRTPEALGRLRAAGLPRDLDWLDEESFRGYDEMGDPTTTAQVHPYQFTTSMADLARERGVEIRTRAQVSSINYNADRSAVESITYISSQEGSSGEEVTIPASDVVIAAGPWTRSVYPSAPVSALRAHSVTIRPANPVSAYALFTQIKYPTSSTRGRSMQLVTPEIYARPNDEVYACGEGDQQVALPSFSHQVAVDEQRCEEIIAHVSSISEHLREGTVTARQACYLPNVDAAEASGPLIGFTGVRGEIMATGHTCWGIQNGPATGKLVSEFVFDGQAKSAKIKSLDPRVVL